jgi:hypothetical protein
MLAIERKKFDFADSQIVNLRQFLREGVKGIELRQRDKIITDILIELRKKSYDFEEVAKEKLSVLKELSKDDVESGWLLQSPEMIIFHTWFADKVDERPYQANYSRGHVYSQVVPL